MNGFALTLWAIADFKLTDLLGSAAATIGIIIGGVIFRQYLSTKFESLLKQYRSITKEYRSGGAAPSRHENLQSQIHSYRRRLHLLAWASWISAAALLGLLASVFAGGLSMLFPDAELIKWIGAGSLLGGLVAMAAAVTLDLAENISARHEIDEEAGDLDQAAKTRAA